jgi:hypothetical protein
VFLSARSARFAYLSDGTDRQLFATDARVHKRSITQRLVECDRHGRSWSHGACLESLERCCHNRDADRLIAVCDFRWQQSLLRTSATAAPCIHHDEWDERGAGVESNGDIDSPRHRVRGEVNGRCDDGVRGRRVNEGGRG